MRMVVREVPNNNIQTTDVVMTSCCCSKQISLTTELNIICKGYYYSYIHWSSLPPPLIIIDVFIIVSRTGSFRVDFTIARWWLWAAKLKSCFPVLNNLLVPFSFFGQEWTGKLDGEKRNPLQVACASDCFSFNCVLSLRKLKHHIVATYLATYYSCMQLVNYIYKNSWARYTTNTMKS